MHRIRVGGGGEAEELGEVFEEGPAAFDGSDGGGIGIGVLSWAGGGGLFLGFARLGLNLVLELLFLELAAADLVEDFEELDGVVGEISAPA